MNILVAENDKITRDHAVVGLENFGNFKVDVSNGMSALEMICQKDYDFAIIGVNPGDNEGPDLLQGIKDRNRRIDLVVMATDIIAKNMHREKMHSNIFAFIGKPVDSLQFHQTINRLRMRILDRS